MLDRRTFLAALTALASAPTSLAAKEVVMCEVEAIIHLDAIAWPDDCLNPAQRRVMEGLARRGLAAKEDAGCDLWCARRDGVRWAATRLGLDPDVDGEATLSGRPVSYLAKTIYGPHIRFKDGDRRVTGGLV